MTYHQALKIFINHGKNKKWIISVIQRWDPKDTIANNARRMCIEYHQAQHFCQFYELGYKLDLRGSQTAKRGALYVPKT